MANSSQILEELRRDESWKVPHKRAMKCYELQEAISGRLSFYRLISGADEVWSRHVQSGKKKFEAAMARNFALAYQIWIAPCPKIIRQATEFEIDGYEVKGAADLRKAYQEVRAILRVNVEQIISGMAGAERRRKAGQHAQ